MPSFVSHISGIAAAGYFALLLAIVACGFNFYTNKQKKALKAELLKAEYEDRRTMEAALQHSPYDLNAPAATQPQPTAQPFGETNANEETAAPAAPNDTNKQ